MSVFYCSWLKAARANSHGSVNVDDLKNPNLNSANQGSYDTVALCRRAARQGVLQTWLFEASARVVCTQLTVITVSHDPSGLSSNVLLWCNSRLQYDIHHHTL